MFRGSDFPGSEGWEEAGAMDYWYGTVVDFQRGEDITWVNVRWFYRPKDIEGVNAVYVNCVYVLLV